MDEKTAKNGYLVALFWQKPCQVKKSFKQTKRNYKKFPSFSDNSHNNFTHFHFRVKRRLNTPLKTSKQYPRFILIVLFIYDSKYLF